MTAIVFEVKCPYCGSLQKEYKGDVSQSPEREVVQCASSVVGHGCKRFFVAEFAVIPTVKTKGIDDDITAIT